MTRLKRSVLTKKGQVVRTEAGEFDSRVSRWLIVATARDEVARGRGRRSLYTLSTLGLQISLHWGLERRRGASMGLRLGFAVCNLSVARRERDVLKAHMIFATPPIGIALRALCYPILCLTQGIFGGQIPYVTSLFLHVASRRRWRA